MRRRIQAPDQIHSNANKMAIGTVSVSESALPLVQQLSKDHDLVLKTFRMLVTDLCQQFGGGHPGYVC